jgi:hypothetical protein
VGRADPSGCRRCREKRPRVRTARYAARDELDAGGPHPFARGIEVIDPEEEADPARDLVTDWMF